MPNDAGVPLSDAEVPLNELYEEKPALERKEEKTREYVVGECSKKDSRRRDGINRELP